MLITTLLLSMSFNFTPLERPHLTVTQGYIESNMNSKAKGKVGEKGAWQVREKYWGKVPKSLLNQAKQAEWILNELLKECNNDLYSAITRYNGTGVAAVRYAAKVRKRTFERVLLHT